MSKIIEPKPEVTNKFKFLKNILYTWNQMAFHFTKEILNPKSNGSSKNYQEPTMALLCNYLQDPIFYTIGYQGKTQCQVRWR
jgi:hypothetical protein